ncbi:MAG: (d)CMP kinase [bacterium]
MKRDKPIVALDGPVGVGKSSVAAALAQRLGFLHVDTGAMYRAVAWLALRRGVDPADSEAAADLARAARIQLAMENGRLRVWCNEEEVTEAIRSPEISAATSPVADNPRVRERLVALQRDLGCRGGVVMEGRDIATVVFPDAELPFFLDADPRARAERRYRQLLAMGKTVTFDETLAGLLERDRRDRIRPVGALKKTDRAIEIDTTSLTFGDVVETLFRKVQDWILSHKEVHR